jgi:hypothetical protein
MRRILVGLAAGFLLATATATYATHVNEPQRPIDAVRLRVLRYSPLLVLPCDGSEAPTRNLRIQAFVHADPTNKEDPSEHFNAHLQVTLHKNGQAFPTWGVNWGHSNQPPHVAALAAFPGLTGGSWMITGDKTNTWVPPERPGLYRVTLTVRTLETGQFFTATCDFRTTATTPGQP